jgi:hypothetical protein
MMPATTHGAKAIGVADRAFNLPSGRGRYSVPHGKAREQNPTFSTLLKMW